MRVSHDPLTFEKHIIMLLKGMRRNKKITQSELANRIGVSRDTIARIESGKARVYMAQVVAIAKALDIALQDLVSVTMEETDLATGEKNTSIADIPSGYYKSTNTFGPSSSSSRRIDIFKDREGNNNPYLNEKAVESYGEPMKEYIMSHKLFWHWVPENSLSGLSISSVVEAVLSLGNEQDISDLFKMVDIKKVSKIFMQGISRSRTNYRDDTITFFDAYFKRHVSEYSD